MTELENYLNDLKNLEINLEKIISKSIIDNEGLILSRLKLRLFNKGIDGSGKKIQPEYSEYTISRKKLEGKRSSHVTLRDTGIFYASIYLEYNKNLNELFVKSDDSKYLFLKEKYGEDILGLTKDEQDFIILSIIEPAVIKELNKLNNRTIDLF